MVAQSSKLTELESQDSLLREDLNPNEELEEKYANLMSRNEHLDSFKNDTNNTNNKLLKKSTQVKM